MGKQIFQRLNRETHVVINNEVNDIASQLLDLPNGTITFGEFQISKKTVIRKPYFNVKAIGYKGYTGYVSTDVVAYYILGYRASKRHIKFTLEKHNA